MYNFIRTYVDDVIHYKHLATVLYIASCPVKGQVYEACPGCQGTCDDPEVSCIQACVGGCVCRPGQLIDTEANRCVYPSQCPVKCSVIATLQLATYIHAFLMLPN